MPYKILAYGFSDIGLVRQNNEDTWAELANTPFYALADGMGGHQAGEVASREAISALCRYVKKKIATIRTQDVQTVPQMLKQVIEQVNSFVYRMGKAHSHLRGMGTTLCCMLFLDKNVIYGHVGDSRIYRLRNNHLQQLTKDHSLLRELVDLGQLNEKQATDFLYKNIITKAIGTESKIEPSVNFCEIEPNDIYMMCSDGLSDLLSHDDMTSIISESYSIQEAVHMLIDTALAKGGHDNITVVLMRVEKLEDEKDLSR